MKLCEVCVRLLYIKFVCVKLLYVTFVCVKFACVKCVCVKFVCVKLLYVKLLYVKFVCVKLLYVTFVCVKFVCVREAAGGRGGGARDTESKTRTPHKVVGNNWKLICGEFIDEIQKGHDRRACQHIRTEFTVKLMCHSFTSGPNTSEGAQATQ